MKPIALSYRDYILSLEQFKTTKTYEQASNYWINRVHTLPNPPSLPLLKQPDTIKDVYLTRRKGYLSAEIWTTLQQQSAQLGITPNVLLMTAFTEILAYWSSTSDLLITVMNVNRHPIHPDVNNLIGNCSTVSLLEIKYQSEDSLLIRAKSLQTQLQKDLLHAAFNGIQVIRETGRIKGVHQTTVPVVFSSTLGLSNNDLMKATTGQHTQPVFKSQYSHLQTPYVWLDHQVFENNGELILNWDVVEELFPENLIDDMFNSYIELLHQITGNEIWNESVLSLLPDHQKQVRAEVNKVHKSIDPQLLQQPFFQQALIHKNKPAIMGHQRSYSYQEIANCVNQVDKFLRERNVKKDEIVAVTAEKGWEQIVAVLGILQAGAVYFSCPKSPVQRMHLLLEKANVRFVLTQTKLINSLEWPSHVETFSVKEIVDFDKERVTLGFRQNP